MKRTTAAYHLALAVALMSACSDADPQRADPQRALMQPITLGATLHAFYVEWPSRTQQQVAERAHAIAEAFSGLKLPPLATVVPGKWVSPFAIPGLQMKYEPSYDRIAIIDSSLLPDNGKSHDVGPLAAQSAMYAMLTDLATRGVIDLSHYDILAPRLSYRRAGIGSKTRGPLSEWITEYRFHLLRKINQVPFANSGVTIGIHRTGRPSSFKLWGPIVNSTVVNGVETHSSQGYSKTRTVAENDIAARFALRVGTQPNVHIHWQRLMYAVDVSSIPTVVEPRHVYSYSERISRGSGKHLVGRRQMLAYSVFDPIAEPLWLSRHSARAASGPLPVTK